MTWFLLSITAALTQALNDTISKRFFGDITAYEMGLIRLLYTLPYLLLGHLLISKPPLDSVFWLCVILGLPMELLAFLCYMKAIKISPLSLTLPFMAFTPAFMIITGNLILEENLSCGGIIGISLIVVGAYLLNLSKIRDQFLAPFKAIFIEKGSRLMLLVAFLYSLTSTIGKLAIKHSSPQFFGFTYFLLFAFLVIMIFPMVPNAKFKNIVKRPIPALFSGLILITMILCHTFAISMVEAAYMISVKRSSIVFGVLFGALVFKEEKIKDRLLGALIMMAGVLVIGFYG
jgi:drug/metabolite transporter (DMT)-like permease